MVPFGEGDRSRFFGREAEIETLVDALFRHPFLTVIGPSGSGKSSLVFAGLVPALRASGLFGKGGWCVRSLRPGERPLEKLGEAIGTVVDPVATVATAFAAEPGAQRLLVVVDQFEEVFTVARAGAGPFQEVLGRLARSPGAWVVLTCRADFYPELMRSPLWEQVRDHRAEVLPLGGSALRLAVVKPAEAVGVFVEAALVERLTSDASGEPGVLPLVQETLVLIWEKLERRFLPLRAYEALVLPLSGYNLMGRDEGEPRTGLQVALARRADATLAELSPERRVIARRLFLRLVQFGEGRADTRRQQSVTELRAAGEDEGEFSTTLDHLVRQRLLTLTGAESGEPRADLAHESLIAGWPTLQGWIRERRDAERARRRLEDMAADWETRRRSRRGGGLLDAAELAEAERWVRSNDTRELGTSDRLSRLLRASRRRVTLTRAARAAVVLLIASTGAYAWLQKLVAERQSAVIAYGQGLDRCQRGETGGGLLWLARGLELAPFTAPDLKRALRLNLDAWRGELNALHWVIPSHDWSHAAAFTPDGRGLIVAAGPSARLWDAETGRELGAFGWTESVVNAVSFSADGRTLLTGHGDGTAQVWDVLTRKLRKTLPAQVGGVWAVALSADGSLALTAGGNPVARLWEVPTGRVVREFKVPAGAIRAVAFSPDGRTALTAGDDPTVWLHDVAAAGPPRALRGHKGVVFSAAFRPDGRAVLTGGSDGTARLWSVPGGQSLGPVFTHTDKVQAVAFSLDGRLVITGSDDRTARVWRTDGSSVGQPLTHLGEVRAVAFSPDGRRAVTAGFAPDAFVWSVATGPRAIARFPHPEPVTSAAFAARGALVVTVTAGRTAFLWDGASAAPVTLPWLDPDQDAPVAVSPGGGIVVTEGRDRLIRLRDRDGGRPRSLDIPERPRVKLVVFSPDESVILTAGSEAQARLWSVADGRPIAALGHSDDVPAAAFSPDGLRVLTGDIDGLVRLWSADGKRLGEVRVESEVLAVALSPDGRTAAVGTAGMTAALLRVGGGGLKPLASLPHRGSVGALAYRLDGRTLFTGSGDWTARFWDAATGQPLGPPLSHDAPVFAVAFSPGNDLALTGSADSTVRLWDVATGRQVGPEFRHSGQVMAVAFHPGGGTFLTASGDGTAYLWSVPVPEPGPPAQVSLRTRVRTGQELDLGDAVRNLTRDSWVRYRSLLPTGDRALSP